MAFLMNKEGCAIRGPRSSAHLSINHQMRPGQAQAACLGIEAAPFPLESWGFFGSGTKEEADDPVVTRSPAMGLTRPRKGFGVRNIDQQALVCVALRCGAVRCDTLRRVA